MLPSPVGGEADRERWNGTRGPAGSGQQLQVQAVWLPRFTLQNWAAAGIYLHQVSRCVQDYKKA